MQKFLLKARGLYTDPNQLTLPDGAFSTAVNVIIDRDDVIESRRGFAQYGDTFGSSSDRVKQLITYKGRILAHYNNTLLFNANEHNDVDDGDFQAFDGEYTETEAGRRIRAQESNKNLYFTTSDGIKKISARTAADFTTNPDFIEDAGVPRALDITGQLDSSTDGFFVPNSEVAYRVVWAYRDNNDNLTLGAPSSRLVVSNFTSASANVDLEFAIPQDIDDNYFYQVYRTAVFTAVGNLTLDDIDPGDEMQLVIEDFPSSSQLTDRIVTITDIAPEDFRAGGLFLYTNPASGDGIDQANEPPPKAKDVTMYQSTLFYANTESIASQTISLLGVGEDGVTDDFFVSGVSAINIDDGTTLRTYTFVGEKEITNVDFSGYIGTVAGLNGKYWLLNSAGNNRKYYVWYDNTQTTQTIDFDAYSGGGAIPDNLDGKFFVLYTQDEDVTYYIWYDKDGNTVDPGLNADNGLTGYLGIRVDCSAFTVNLDIATDTRQAIIDVDAGEFYDVSSLTGAEFSVSSEAFDDTATPVIQTIQRNFSLTIDTPDSVDPNNSTNQDILDVVAGRTGIRVNVSRNVTTNEDIARVTANSIIDQDNAADFDVSYNGDTNDEFLDILNTNNGETEDAIDGPESDATNGPVANSFAITVTQQGNGQSQSDGTITATTTGATITVTSAAHELEDGDVVNISGSDTTPSIDGRYIIANTTTNTYDITPINPVTVAGTTGSWYQNDVLLSASISSGQQIDETARSLVTIINRDEFSPVYAYYISGANDIPGQILLQAKDIGTNQFSITADSSSTGNLFNPTLPAADGSTPDVAAVIGESEVKPNRIYFAKLQQPEAVPPLNFIDVGPEDKAISRILSLRESLFLLKEDGVYRLTGSGGVFNVDLFDESTQIIAPDSAVVLNNQIYCLTNQGVTVISDTGISIISRQIDNEIKIFSSNRYDYEFTTFGVAYETDRSYLLWMPSATTDDVATQAYRYSTSTNSWTKYDLAKTCGLINSSNDKLYLGPNDVNFIEQERKLFDRTDYADRNFDLSIPANAVNRTTLRLSTAQNVVPGDAIIQTQYLTIGEYNQLLAKLDLDPQTGSPEITEIDFSGYTDTIPNLHSKYFFIYAGSNSTKYCVYYDATGDLTSLDTTIFTDTVGSQQIRVIVADDLTLEEVALSTRAALSSITTDFIATHSAGNEFITVRTTRNGETNDAFDSTSNGIGNGFALNVTTQGVGNYVNDLQATNGANLAERIVALAQTLDADPGVDQTDYESSLGPLTNFEQIQTEFNNIIDKLNVDTGVFYTYTKSVGVKDFEVIVVEKANNTTDVILQFETRFVEGPVTIYQGIPCEVTYSPEIFGDPSISKHVREGTLIFEDNNFSRGTVAYKTDKSPGFAEQSFSRQGKGDYGLFTWGEHNWGGGFSGVPFRTYVPRDKQRNRYIQTQFKHDSAREQFKLYGLSYTFRLISERAYRD